MKKTLFSLAIASAMILSACSSKKEDTTREMVFLNDSMYRSSMNTDTAALVEQEPEIEEEEPVAPARPTAYKKPQRTPNKGTKNSNVYTPKPTREPAVTPPTPAPVETTTANTPAPSTSPSASTGTETASQPAEVEKKKDGISNGAKGAILGGIGGAAAGGIITRKGKGAVIGGVIGAAGGYILGRKKDKAEGRIE